MAEFLMTPTYDRLLRGSLAMPFGLYHLHTATAEQLCRLHYKPGALTTVKARLKTLADNGYMKADAIQTKSCRSPYYYRVGQKGIRYLEKVGLDIDDAFRASKETDKDYLSIQHALGLSDVLIAATLLKRTNPSYCLDSFVHEQALKRSPYKATWKANGRSESFSLIPDAFLDFRLSLAEGRQRRMPILLEHDRGTEEQRHFKQRIRAYIVLLQSEAYKELFGVKAITVAFTTFVGEKRRDQMREWTQQELAATNEPQALGMAFYFTYMPQPLDPGHLWIERCWYSPYEQQPIGLLEQ